MSVKETDYLQSIADYVNEKYKDKLGGKVVTRDDIVILSSENRDFNDYETEKDISYD